MSVTAASVQGQSADAQRDSDARETARMLKTLIGNIDGMVYRCHNDAQWTMEFVSDGCLAVTGYRPEDLLFNQTVSYERLTHPEDRLRVRAAINAALSQGRRFDVEYRIIGRDGAERWVWERGTGLYGAGGQVLAVEGIVQDISARESTHRALRNAERRYRSLFDHALEGIFRTTPDGRYLDANPALARIYGFETPLELMNTMSDIGSQLYVDAARRQAFIDAVRRHGRVSGFESQVRRRDGRLIWISENARAVHDESGRLRCYEGTVEDITALREYQQKIERQARQDDLTGLANRLLLRERLQDAVSAASQSGGRFALVFVDLDRFKYINDSLGHHAGDELLCVMAERLSGCAAPGTTVARMGGDEFVLLVPEADESAARELTRRILKATGEVWHFKGGEFRVNGSVGVALYPDHGRDPDSLLKNADAAMYHAKDQGRSTLRFFSPELSRQMNERLDAEKRLREAIRNEHLLLHFQPRAHLPTDRIVGAEALVRWQAPGGPLVPPAVFIAVAEETGLIVDIGRYVLRAACEQARAWHAAGHADFIVSVNASPRELQQERYADLVMQALRESGLPPACLEIEITESMVVHDAPRLIRMLNRLRDLGVHIAIDDFGTGYSNLRYLQRFPAQRLKIDRSFIADIHRNDEDAAIVRAIITLGHSLGMQVVAEGVETGAQLQLLRGLGCDEVQGYLLGPPMTPRELESRLVPLR
ncbi:MAG TPA: EAL domain-containing protein [Steroidobacteraceae bacterium]|nr:EAL domain-containing protein [Steroidobacteraceae bacterium]